MMADLNRPIWRLLDALHFVADYQRLRSSISFLIYNALFTYAAAFYIEIAEMPMPHHVNLLSSTVDAGLCLIFRVL